MMRHRRYYRYSERGTVKYASLLVLTAFLVWPCSAQPLDLRFEHFTVEDGLANNRVLSIVQDCDGFLWLGTRDGLNKYDGYTFTTYRHNPADPSTIYRDRIEILHVGPSCMLWIGHFHGGLDRFDPRTKTVTRFLPDAENPQSLVNDKVHTILEDEEGYLWVGTISGGLDRLDLATGVFTNLSNDSTRSDYLGSDHVRALHKDRRGALWVGSGSPFHPGGEGGLWEYHASSRSFTRYLPAPDRSSTATANYVMSIQEDSDGQLWITTPHDGLYRFDPAAKTFTPFGSDSAMQSPRLRDGASDFYGMFAHEQQTRPGTFWIGSLGGGLNYYNAHTGVLSHYEHDPPFSHSLSSNEVWSLFEDRQGTIWIATWNGLNKVVPPVAPVEHFVHRSDHPDGLRASYIFMMDEGPDGEIWIGMRGGLDRFDRATGMFTHYSHDPGDPAGLSSEHVFVTYVDRAGVLWAGTRQGLNRLDPDTGRFTRYLHDPSDPASLSDDQILTIYEDRKGTLWVGTKFGGLSKMNRETGTFTHYRYDPGDAASLSADWVSFIREDSRGAYWVGTTNGLNRFDPTTGRFVRYTHDPDQPSSLGHDNLSAFFEDRDGIIWLGGGGGGLNRFDPAADVFTHFTEADGLSSNTIYCIVDDEGGHLWLSTSQGLTRFDPQTESARTFDVIDGMPENAYTIGACLRAQDGTLFFGGVSGITAFEPTQLLASPPVPPVPPVAISSIRKLNQEILHHVRDRNGDRITLSHDDNIFSIEYAVRFMGDQTHPRIEIGAEKGEAGVQCFIRDNGVGIPPQYHEKVFGLFERLDSSVEGTGVGLAIVKRIIEVHGGKIWIASEGNGKGACFNFTLPDARQEAFSQNDG